MASCKNRVDYYVPKGYDYKKLDYKCGTTGIDGEAVMCRECLDKIASRKMAKPGYCIHGTKLTEFDCDCRLCEEG